MLREIEERLDREFKEIRDRMIFTCKLGLCVTWTVILLCLVMLAADVYRHQYLNVLFQAMFLGINIYLFRFHWERLK